MNAPFSPPVVLTDAHRGAIDAICRWRGHCVDLFARIERDCIDALEAMIDSGRMPALKSPALFGARIEEVRKGLDSGHFDKAANAKRAVDKLADALKHRNDIVHGVGQVWLDAHGRWLWRFSYRSNAKGHAKIEGAFEFAEADKLEKTLSSGARSLHDTLRNVIKAIGENSTAKSK